MRGIILPLESGLEETDSSSESLSSNSTGGPWYESPLDSWPYSPPEDDEDDLKGSRGGIICSHLSYAVNPRCHCSESCLEKTSGTPDSDSETGGGMKEDVKGWLGINSPVNTGGVSDWSSCSTSFCDANLPVRFLRYRVRQGAVLEESIFIIISSVSNSSSDV